MSFPSLIFYTAGDFLSVNHNTFTFYIHLLTIKKFSFQWPMWAGSCVKKHHLLPLTMFNTQYVSVLLTCQNSFRAKVCPCYSWYLECDFLPPNYLVKVTRSCLTLCDPNPMDYAVQGILQARILEWCHSLLQGIFPTKASNPGPRHRRRILYQLSHQESPFFSRTMPQTPPLLNFSPTPTKAPRVFLCACPDLRHSPLLSQVQ